MSKTAVGSGTSNAEPEPPRIWSSVDTAFQLDPSAQAPWTRTIVGFGVLLL
jgi:hypothetical protein